MNFDSIPNVGEPKVKPIKLTQQKQTFDTVTPERIRDRLADPDDSIHKQIMGALYKFREGKYEDEASDLYQIVLLKILRGAHGFKNRSAFSSWVYSIAHNVFIDFIKRNKTRDGVFDSSAVVDEKEIPYRLHLRSRISPTETEIIDKIFLDSLLKNLSQDELAIFQMKKEGFSSAEIAEKLKIPKSTFTTRFGLLVNKLRVLANKNSALGKT